DEHPVAFDRVALALLFVGDDDAVASALGAEDLDAELHLEALLAERALALLGELFVDAGQEGGEVLEPGHLGAEALPDGAELEADDATADDDEVLGDAGVGEGLGGGADAVVVELDAADRRGLGSRGDEDAGGGEGLGAAALEGDLDLTGTAKGAEAVVRQRSEGRRGGRER